MRKYNEEYVEDFDDYNLLLELNSDSYLEFTTDCAREVKEKSDRILELTAEYDDQERIIKVSKSEIKELKQKIARAKAQKRTISSELKEERRSLKVDIKFLNKLNNSMNSRRGGAHLVDYQKRKIK